MSDYASEAFATITSFRLAARTIVRDESLGDGREVAIARLLDRANREHGSDGFLVRQINRVILQEAGEYLLEGRTPTAPAESYSASRPLQALRRLHARGLARCPECLRPTPHPDLIAQWDDQERRLWLETVRREGAPDREAEAVRRSPDGAA